MSSQNTQEREAEGVFNLHFFIRGILICTMNNQERSFRALGENETVSIFTNPAEIVNLVERFQNLGDEERLEAYESFRVWVNEGIERLVKRWKSNGTRNQDLCPDSCGTFCKTVDGFFIQVDHRPGGSYETWERMEIDVETKNNEIKLKKLRVEATESDKKRILNYSDVNRVADFGLISVKNTQFSIEHRD